jgi:hypothetical protein
MLALSGLPIRAHLVAGYDEIRLGLITPPVSDAPNLRLPLQVSDQMKILAF